MSQGGEKRKEDTGRIEETRRQEQSMRQGSLRERKQWLRMRKGPTSYIVLGGAADRQVRLVERLDWEGHFRQSKNLL